MSYTNPYSGSKKIILESFSSISVKKKGKNKKKAKKTPYKADCFDPNEYKTHAYRTKYE